MTAGYSPNVKAVVLAVLATLGIGAGAGYLAISSFTEYAEISAPDTPAATKVRVYAKADGKLYSKDDAGVETALGGGSSLPASDSTSVVEGSADDTKEVRFEVDGLTTGTVRVMTIPDRNITLGNAADLTGALPAIDGSALTGISGGVSSDADGNTLGGTSALDSITAGQAIENTAFGKNTLTAITTGDGNTAIGFEAGITQTTDSNNIFIGAYAGRETTGSNNTFTGGGAGTVLVGARNSLYGFSANGQGTAANDQCVFGYNAADNNEASGTIAIGANALTTATTGTGNTACGFESGMTLTSGANNTFVGYQTGKAQTTTTADNVYIGASAADSITTGTRNVAIGKDALGGASATGADDNVIIGNTAGDAVTTGDNNVYIGSNTAGAITSSSDNVILGKDAASTTTASSNNVIIGSSAASSGALNSTGFNVVIGKSCAASLTGNGNVLIGGNIGTITSGTNNVIIGRGARTESGSSSGAIALGDAASADSNEFVVGGNNPSITNWYSGNGKTNAAAASYTINGTGGSGSNNAGADLLLAGGKGTGTAAQGVVGVKYPLTAASGSTLQSLSSDVFPVMTNMFTQTANGTDVTNTTTETNILGTGVGTLTIPAGFLIVGRTIRITTQGFFATGTSQTITVNTKFGSVEVCSSGLRSMVDTLTTHFKINVVITCRTVGATGTVFATGTFETGEGGNVRISPLFNNSAAPTTATVDTTASNAITINADWDAADASNHIQAFNTVVEVLR